MKQNKLMAGALALALSLGLCVPAAMAEDLGNTKTSTEITISSTVHLPTFKVTIGTPSNIVVNPYGIEYEVDATHKPKDTIISADTLITNKSTVDVKVTATPSVKADGVTFCDSTTALGTETTLPAVFLQMEMANIDASNTPLSDTTGKVTNKKTTVVKKEGTTPGSEAVDVTMAKTTDAAPNYAAFKFSGETGGKKEAWTTTNAITVKVIFSVDVAPTA